MNAKRLCWSEKQAGRHAFTLAEVCVAGAVVAFALLLAAQAGRHARATSKQSVCLSRLGQVIEASIIYASFDPNENLIPAHARGVTNGDNPRFLDMSVYGGKSGLGRVGFCGNSQDPTSALYGTRCGYGPSTRPLNLTLYGDVFPDYREGTQEQQLADTRLVLASYLCPSDAGFVGAHCTDYQYSEQSSYDHFGTSYVANTFYTGGAEGGGTIKSSGPFLHPASEIPDPARTLAYWENAGRFAWAVREDPCDFLPGINPRTPNDTVGGWHGKDWTYNAAFADGHVGTIFMHSYSPHQETSYPLNPSGGGGSYQFYRCVLIRGDNWQLDVYPAASVELGLMSGGGRPSYAGCVSP